MLRSLAPILVLALALGGCSLLGDSNDRLSDPIVLAGGVSFGECIGYCRADLVVDLAESGVTATITWTGWSPEIEPVSASRVMNEDLANELVETLNRQRLLDAEEVYGCPDCADGGAEYVELREGPILKRVTFEAGDEVAGLDALIVAMRDLRALFDDEAPVWEP